MPEQAQRYEADVWTTSIAAFLRTRHDETGKAASRDLMAAAKDTVVTISEVAREALGFDTEGRVGTHDQRRIEATVTELGWERAKRGPNGERWWRPTAAWTTVGKPSGGSGGWV